MVAFDTTWGNSYTYEEDFSAQSVGDRTIEISGKDLINVPDRGQPRVFKATWIWEWQTPDTYEFPINLDQLWIDWYIGVGLTNLTTRTYVYAARIVDAPTYIDLPAQTLRAKFGASILVTGNPAAEQRFAKLSMTLICGPFYPFANDERQAVRGSY